MHWVIHIESESNVWNYSIKTIEKNDMTWYMIIYIFISMYTHLYIYVYVHIYKYENSHANSYLHQSTSYRHVMITWDAILRSASLRAESTVKDMFWLFNFKRNYISFIWNHIYIYIYICIYVYIYIYIFIYIHINTYI